MSKLFHASVLHWWITGCLWRINPSLGGNSVANSRFRVHISWKLHRSLLGYFSAAIILSWDWIGKDWHWVHRNLFKLDQLRFSSELCSSAKTLLSVWAARENLLFPRPWSLAGKRNGEERTFDICRISEKDQCNVQTTRYCIWLVLKHGNKPVPDLDSQWNCWRDQFARFYRPGHISIIDFAW